MGVFEEFPTSRVVVLGLGVGGGFGLLGVVLGVGWLYSFLADARPIGIYGLHWLTMMYGFLNIFIIGVSSTLHPLFFNSEPSPRHSVPVLSILTVGVVFILISNLGIYMYSFGLTLLILGNIIYSLYILSIAKLNNPYFYYGDILCLVGFVAYPLALAAALYQSLYHALGGFGSYYPILLLYSYAIPIIYGVMIRLIKFKFSKINVLASKMTLYSYIPSLILLYLGMVVGGQLPLITSSVLILVSSIGEIYAVNMFEHDVEEPYRSRLRPRDWKKYRFFTRHLNIAAVWLIYGSLTLLIYSLNWVFSIVPGQIYLWDMALHSLTIGFIGNIIIAYSGYMLPSLVFRKYAYRNLSLIPYILINIGNLLRIVGDTLRIFEYYELFTPYSGILILLGYIYTIIMLIRLMRE